MAEARTREAPIEAALERVRGRALAMRDSIELIDIIVAIKHEVNELSGGDVWESNVILDEDEHTLRIWHVADVPAEERERFFSAGITYPKLADPKHPWLQQIAHSDEPYRDIIMDRKEILQCIVSLEHYVPEFGAQLRHWFEKGKFDFEHTCIAAIDRGWLTLQFLKTPPDDIESCLTRMASVLSMAMSRADELEKAEAQTREAQIEFSLERVRGRTAGMHESAEWGEVLGIAFEEMRRVGFDINMSVLVQYDTSSWDSDFWISGFGQDIAPVSYFTKRVDHPIADRFLEAYKSEEDFFHISFGGEEKRVYDELLLSQEGWVDAPQSLKDGIRSVPEVHVSSAKLGSGWIQIASVERLPEKMESLLRRFGAVIRMMNTRFQDLKEAEAAAREAQIEASLERLRGRAMAMQKPGDIGEVSILLFDELEGLEMKSLRSGIGFPSDDGTTYEFRLRQERRMDRLRWFRGEKPSTCIP